MSRNFRNSWSSTSPWYLRFLRHGRLFRALVTTHVPDWRYYDAIRRRMAIP